MTGLAGILQTALSGLNTNQAALRATSTNITNVNTPGYTRRLVELQSLNIFQIRLYPIHVHPDNFKMLPQIFQGELSPVF